MLSRLAPPCRIHEAGLRARRPVTTALVMAAHGLFGWVVEVPNTPQQLWLSADYEARLLRCSAATPKIGIGYKPVLAYA